MFERDVQPPELVPSLPRKVRMCIVIRIHPQPPARRCPSPRPHSAVPGLCDPIALRSPSLPPPLLLLLSLSFLPVLYSCLSLQLFLKLLVNGRVRMWMRDLLG